MFDISLWIEWAGQWGYLLLFIIVFFESFPLTFFLPGDSLLFTVGFLASTGLLNFPLLVGLLFVSAVLGYICSYFFGRWIKGMIYSEQDTFWFRRKHFIKTKEFYDRYGSKTLILGRFIPIVRSLSAALAGAVEMPFERFIAYTSIGAVVWVGGVTSIGFYLGRLFPEIDVYLTPIILLIVLVSVSPAIFEYIQSKRKKV